MKNFIGPLVLVISVAIVVVLTAMNSAPEEREDVKELMSVGVLSIKPQKTVDVITGYGQIQPRWQTKVSSEVVGRVLSVSDKFLSGYNFAKGDVLATIEDTSYKAALAEAEAGLARAKRVLMEEEERSRIAMQDWKSSAFHDKAPSGLVTRKQHVKEARTAVESAEAALVKAKYDLEQTVIKAPYDGAVITRSINPGDYIQNGTQIGEIYSKDLFEVRVALAADKIKRLKPLIDPKIEASIKSPNTDAVKEAFVSRIEQTVDTQNRQQNIVIEIADTEGLLPTDYVSVNIFGRAYDSILAVPEAMPGKDGYIWYVDHKNTLQHFKADILFAQNGMLYVLPPTFLDADSLNIVTQRESYLPDVKVEPVFMAGSQAPSETL